MARFRTDMYEDNPFVIRPPQQQQQQQQPGMLGLGGLSTFMNIMPGGGAGTGTGVGTAGGAGAGTGTGGMGSAAAAAGPWAALAAIIIGNELMAKKGGYRSEDPKEHMKDILSTEVLNQDIEQRWLPKLGIDEDSKLSKGISLAMNPGSFNFSNTWDRIKDIF